MGTQLIAGNFNTLTADKDVGVANMETPSSS